MVIRYEAPYHPMSLILWKSSVILGMAVARTLMSRVMMKTVNSRASTRRASLLPDKCRGSSFGVDGSCAGRFSGSSLVF